MKVIAKKNRELALINARNTQNENRTETIELVVPEEYENYNKKIVFITPDGSVWDVITDNKYKLTNAITKYEKVNFYIWLTKEVDGENIDFRTKTRPLSFYHNVDASDEITDEEIHGVNTVVNLLEEEIEKVENLNIEATKIGDTTTITITKKDGTTESVEINDGVDGQDGADGYTPQKGVDYFTEQDIEEIEGDILNEVYTKSETDTLLDEKADVEDIPDVSNFITKDVNNLTNYTLKTNTGSLIDLEINDTTYVVTLKLKNQDGTVISTDTIDLPLESVVVSGRYDNTTKKVILTLENGSEVDFSVADLVAGLQTEITSQNKLASDLVDDTNSGNKFVTTSEKQTWNNKYDKPNGGILKTDLASDVQTSLGKADTAIQSHQDISGKEDKTNKVTSISSSSTDTQYPSAKSVYDSQTTQDDEIETLQTENTRLKATLPTTTGEGEDITLDKTAEMEFVKPPLPMGNSEQVTRILPEGYTQLDYIESTGTQYIDTGYKPTNLTEIEISFYLNGVAVETSSSQQLCLFGCYDNNNWWLLGNYKVADDMFGEFIWAGGKASANLLGYSKQKISFINGIYTDSSGNTKTVNISTSKTSQQNLYIMARNKNGNAEQYFNGKIYTFKMWESNVLIRNYIPCKNANNEIGLYDLITNTFYGNSGTGTFVAGNEAIIPNPDYPQEITNVTGDVDIVVQNKNLWNTNFKKGGYDMQGNFSPTDKVWITNSLPITVNSNTQYTITQKETPTSYRISFFNNETYLSYFDMVHELTNGYKSCTFTTPANCNKIYVSFRSTKEIISSGTYNMDVTDITNVQLEINSTPTDYVEHKEQTFIFPLGNEKLMLGDYLADDGIHHKIQEDDLSTLTWASLGSNLYRSTAIDNIKIPATTSTVPNILAEKYKARMQAGNFLNGEIAIMGAGNFAGDLLVCDETGTPSGLIQYELEQEVIVPYTSAQQEVYNQIKQALSYEEQTNISSNQNALFNVEAYQSTKLILQNLDSRLTLVEG